MPLGGPARPSLLASQHATEPSTRTPQLCPTPALSRINRLSDGVTRPISFCAPALNRPRVADGTTVTISRGDLNELSAR